MLFAVYTQTLTLGAQGNGCSRAAVQFLTSSEFPNPKDEPLLLDFLNRLQKRFPEAFTDQQDFKVVSIEAQYRRYWLSAQYTLDPRLFNVPIGYAHVQVKNTTMRFDIDIYPQAQGLKLYAYLMALALKENPQVENIPSIMDIKNSENARIFLKKLYDQIQAVSENALTDSEVVKKLREKIINAYFETPAAKARAKNGFSNLQFIALDLPKGSYNVWQLSFNARRGALLEGSVQVYLSNGIFGNHTGDKTLYALNADGSVEKVPESVATPTDYSAVF